MAYVDGFVFSVPKKNLAAYKKMAMLGKKMWMEHGALDYKECMADDVKTAKGMTSSFPKIAKTKKDEIVFFSFIVFKSRKHRDSVNAKVMKDPSMDPGDMKEMPFDIKRMTYGGFKAIIEA